LSLSANLSRNVEVEALAQTFQYALVVWAVFADVVLRVLVVGRGW
jgi:hypothetical protein